MSCSFYRRRNEQTKLSERAGKDHRGKSEGRQGSTAVPSQLLRSLQQLCAGIFKPIFSDHGFFLQSQHFPKRGV